MHMYAKSQWIRHDSSTLQEKMDGCQACVPVFPYVCMHTMALALWSLHTRFATKNHNHARVLGSYDIEPIPGIQVWFDPVVWRASTCWGTCDMPHWTLYVTYFIIVWRTCDMSFCNICHHVLTRFSIVIPCTLLTWAQPRTWAVIRDAETHAYTHQHNVPSPWPYADLAEWCFVRGAAWPAAARHQYLVCHPCRCPTCRTDSAHARTHVCMWVTLTRANAPRIVYIMFHVSSC